VAIPRASFGTYNTVATLAGSAGALAAALVPALGVEPQRLLLVYVAVGVVGAFVARGLSGSLEATRRSAVRPARPLTAGIVRRLSALFALDSFGGGFVTQAFIAYWFTENFGTSLEVLGGRLLRLSACCSRSRSRWPPGSRLGSAS
jgi:uncharacterized membrane protein YeaQ/YmgE (transglycosylase-associated protein family)